MGKKMSNHNYWQEPGDQILTTLHSTPTGLSRADAAVRLQSQGPNLLQVRPQLTAWRSLLEQFKNPLVLILIFAAVTSAFLAEWVDATVVLLVVFSSAGLSFWQEHRASTAVEKLRARVKSKATVLRDGQPQTIVAEEVVVGDVVLLSAGSLIPADGLVLTAKDFFVNQAVLTGETFPVEKKPGPVTATATLAARTNCVFMGTSVRSGTAQAVIVQTGTATVFGQIAQRLTLRPPETAFERGIRRFGTLLTQVMLALVLVVFAANVFLAKPAIDALLFAIALAVGLTPELLPTIISVTLAQGAQRMATLGVIVRRLDAIENLGNMNVLCTDKTGTLTLGVVQLDGAVDWQGQPSPSVLQAAYRNAFHQTGLSNGLDEAIIAHAQQGGGGPTTGNKVDEIPYDFVRKRLSVVVRAENDQPALITKGAFDTVLAICTNIQADATVTPLDADQRAQLQQRYLAWSNEGFRVLGIAGKPVAQQPSYTVADEQELTFLGFLLFFDPPKPGVEATLAGLSRLGVQLKIITGDNRQVAHHLATTLGLPVTGIVTGSQLDELHEEALWHVADNTTLFAEVDPNQKERIILALRKMGHVVGYMGDGINDAPALHAADVGISVDTAVDVAKEAADFVLLEKDLAVLRAGIEEGRRTFANTLKYIFTTTSANFGNMLSMAGASLFLPFLPLLAKQILLNNFLSDIPGMTIAGDNVDEELVQTPQRWNITFIRNFMVVFGLVSSVFDYLTFGVLLFLFQTAPDEFRTGWFIESLLTELVIALVVRTRKPFYRSRPGRLLWLSTLVVTAITLALPYLPFAPLFGLVPLPAPLFFTLLLITALYVTGAEIAKRFFYARAAAVVTVQRPL
ncbi:MAG: magnesium-translocating P-type ATPase [Caldilinea sp. CFX5]|nr:magnesium-translocating P-type ATPase [Caldilinea sp. CFX5]